MMNLLQGFNQSWFQRYDQNNNSAAADTFRATLMVAAISYGFAKDLRSDFRNLNFPISDQIYNELYNSVTPIPNDVIVNVGATTKEFSLCQNYPNPFNPTTVISWQFPPEADQPSAEAVGSFVTVKVYDVLGREVKTLINKIQGAGKHSVSFDASNFANGIYFYQLRAGNFISTKKMVILK
jgi:hypothetical protein